jgi:hypothetical protein
MTFDDDWAALKADAQERHSTQMRLNTTGAGSAASGTDADLVVHQGDLGAVRNEAN